ncbi:MAG: hypothetical protein PHU25_07965 [Deltaproteobacteria bacterium]|nr:hypothetical protein [Deltaproteobacteria bacterium]
MASERIIFVGFEVTDDVAGGLARCRESDRVFLLDPAYLETVTIEGRKYIGKRVGNGASFESLDDAARSVVSILMRVRPGSNLRADDVLLAACEPMPGPDGTAREEGYPYWELLD